MRKWLVALTVIFCVSFIISASLAGKVYYQESMVYTEHDKKSLDLTNINSIYINSDIPVTIKPTTGEAYAEFNQSYENILGDKPMFELKVENKDKACRINLTQTKEVNLNFGIKRNEKSLVVYLPVKELETLKVDYNGFRDVYNIEEIDLTGFNIKNVEIKQHWTDVKLDGNYENINLITGGASEIDIKSKKQANVKLNGSANYKLEGLFKTLDIIHADGKPIIMNDCKVEQVNIEADSSEIQFEGEYTKVKVLGDNNIINLQTSTLCDVTIENNYGEVVLDGPFNNVNIDGEAVVADIQTINPKSIKVKGEENQTTLNLPTHIAGFKLMCMAEELNDGESIDQYTVYDVNEAYEGESSEASSKILSEFKLTEQNKNIYTYGDGSSRIMIRVGKSLNILESGQIAAQ